MAGRIVINPKRRFSVRWWQTPFIPPSTVLVNGSESNVWSSAMQTLRIRSSPSASLLSSFSSLDSPFCLIQNSQRARACRGQRAKLTSRSHGVFYEGESVCVCVWFFRGLKEPAVEPWTSVTFPCACIRTVRVGATHLCLRRMYVRARRVESSRHLCPITAVLYLAELERRAAVLRGENHSDAS